MLRYASRGIEGLGELCVAELGGAAGIDHEVLEAIGADLVERLVQDRDDRHIFGADSVSLMHQRDAGVLVNGAAGFVELGIEFLAGVV